MASKADEYAAAYKRWCDEPELKTRIVTYGGTPMPVNVTPKGMMAFDGRDYASKEALKLAAWIYETFGVGREGDE